MREDEKDHHYHIRIPQDMQAMAQKECNSKGTRKPPLSGFLSFAILAICSFTRSVQTTRLKGLGLGLGGGGQTAIKQTLQTSQFFLLNQLMT